MKKSVSVCKASDSSPCTYLIKSIDRIARAIPINGLMNNTPNAWPKSFGFNNTSEKLIAKEKSTRFPNFKLDKASA